MPTVLLPRHLLTELNRDQIKSILAHELAHIRRRDHWTHVFGVLVLSLNFWNPIAWWASRKLQQAKEECCDAWVVWAFPHAARQYAQTLVDVVEFQCRSPDRRPDVATAFSDGSSLGQRITLIVEKKVSRRLSWPIRTAVAIFALVVIPLLI